MTHIIADCLDINDQYSDLEDIVNDIENRTDIHLHSFNVQEAEFEWDDDIDINHRDCIVENYRNYFK